MNIFDDYFKDLRNRDLPFHFETQREWESKMKRTEAKKEKKVKSIIEKGDMVRDDKSFFKNFFPIKTFIVGKVSTDGCNEYVYPQITLDKGLECNCCMRDVTLIYKRNKMKRTKTKTLTKEQILVKAKREGLKVHGEFDSVKDSGERREFSTGSVRDVRTGKGRFDLITPIGLKRLAVHYENGAKKYGDRNWEKGQPLSSYLDSAIRHLYCLLEGKNDEDHAAAVAWNAMAYIHTEEMVKRGLLPVELNDMPIEKGTKGGYLLTGNQKEDLKNEK